MNDIVAQTATLCTSLPEDSEHEIDFVCIEKAHLLAYSCSIFSSYCLSAPALLICDPLDFVVVVCLLEADPPKDRPPEKAPAALAPMLEIVSVVFFR